MIYNYYTDGASTMRKVNGEYVRENGGWAFAQAKEGKPVFSMSGHEDKTTNQAMELRAIYEALNHYHKHYYSANITDTVNIYSDSAYSINIYTDWIKGWEANGFKRKGNKPIENLEIIKKTWKLLKILNSGFNNVSFIKVKGHSNDPMNEYVDGLAVAAKYQPLNPESIQGKRVELNPIDDIGPSYNWNDIVEPLLVDEPFTVNCGEYWVSSCYLKENNNG